MKKVVVESFGAKQFSVDGVHEALKTLREGTTIKNLIVPNL